ncbi:MAG: hypothetical protein OK422_04045 [Thaumarchaeota archaeon]|nr:hypothetical protein [Nitrososphaerota archaeon]
MNSKTSVRLALAIGSGGAVLGLYGVFLVELISGGTFLPQTAFEYTILSFQLFKLAIIASIKRLREGSMAFLFDIFAVEMLVFPVLIVLALATGEGAYLGFAGSIFFVWPSAVLIVFPLISIYRFVRSVLRVGAPSGVLPTAISHFGLFAFVLGVVNSTSTSGGLAGLSKQLITALVSQASLPADVLSTETEATAALALYVSLILYATWWREKRLEPKRLIALVVPLGGTLAATGWTLLVDSLIHNALLIFGVPTVVTAVALWWLTRAS